MMRLLLAAALAVLCLGTLLLSGEDDALPEGTYRKKASEKTLRGWLRDFARKRDLVPRPPDPPGAGPPRPVDFTGSFRFGSYDYDLVMEQAGDQVVFRSGGVDRQDIGGAFDTVGHGTVEDGKLRARWWCLDLSRNYANTGGAEIWFHEGNRDLLYVRYYHDADEKIEEGYGARLGTHEGRRLHYRVRIPQPTRVLERPRELAGTVRGRGGEALADAVVMLRHDEASAVRTDAAGRCAIPVTKVPSVLMASAAAPGYRTQVQALLLQEWRDLDFVLEPSPWSDDPRYAFVSPEPDKGREIWRCGNCHKNSYAEWSGSRHALAAKSVVLKAVYEKDFLPALAAGRAKGDEGLCAACHAPEAALDGAVARMDRIEGVALHGNHCDFCHKVHHVERVDAPGVRGSLVLGRPSPDDPSVPGPIKRIYGALADSDYLFMGPVWNPFFATSTLCAGCHQYTTPEGVPALDTYREWAAWAAGEADARSCQSCHMPTGTSMEGTKLARRICVNALRRPQEQIHDHSFLGRDLAPAAVRLEPEARREGGRLVVRTEVEAVDVGHKVPTGSSDRHLILLVLATDAAGRPLARIEGPLVPAHAGGEGDPLALDAAALDARREAGDFAGMPGREFAQVLEDADGSTHVPFWRAARLREDTRLAPGEPVRVEHVFAAPAGAVKLRVELWHRLRFKAHDPAAGVEGPGARPLDKLLTFRHLDVR